MNYPAKYHITDKNKPYAENIKRLSVRILQLESLVSIQSEIINFLSNDKNAGGNHPLLKISKAIQRSLIPPQSPKLPSPEHKPAHGNDLVRVDIKRKEVGIQSEVSGFQISKGEVETASAKVETTTQRLFLSSNEQDATDKRVSSSQTRKFHLLEAENVRYGVNMEEETGISQIPEVNSKSKASRNSPYKNFGGDTQSTLNSFLPSGVVLLEAASSPSNNTPAQNGNSCPKLGLSQKSLPARGDFPRNSNSWLKSVTAPYFLIEEINESKQSDSNTSDNNRSKDYWCSTPDTNPDSCDDLRERLNYKVESGIISPCLSPSPISFESEVDIINPREPTSDAENLPHEQSPEIPIIDETRLHGWASSQRNNSKRSEIKGDMLNPRTLLSFCDAGKGVFRKDFASFIEACHLLEQSLENPKTTSPSEMVHIMPKIRDYWFYTTTSSAVTVNSLEAILSAISNFSSDVISRVVNQHDKEGRTFLHIAVRRRLWPLIEMALEECPEFDPDQVDDFGATPLSLMLFLGPQHMCAEEHLALDSLVRRSSEATRSSALLAAASIVPPQVSNGRVVAMVSRLCARGTSLQADRRDVDGNTALMLAVSQGNVEVARRLILLRPDICNIRARNKKGQTVMDLVKSCQVTKEIMRLLRGITTATGKNLVPTRGKTDRCRMYYRQRKEMKTMF